MVDHIFSDPLTLQRLHLGPLGPHIDAFARHLSERGYANWTAEEKIRVVSRLSQWLQARDRRVEDLNKEVVSQFLKYRRRKGLSLHGAPPAIRDLLKYLRDGGIIPCARVERRSFDAIGECFVQYLVEERGLAKPTIDNYVATARVFLSERFGQGPIVLEDFASKDITDFILRHR